VTDWRRYIAHRCMLGAGNVGLVKYGVDELGKLPSHVIEVAQAKVHELMSEAARMQSRGDAERAIQQHIERELWHLLRDFRPAKLSPESISKQG